MTKRRSIRLFLVDGTSTGLLTAEIMNWTGHVLTGPRSKLSELVQRPECARTGVYFLVGPDPDDDLLTRVYIGESDDIAQRLRQHNHRALPESDLADMAYFLEQIRTVLPALGFDFLHAAARAYTAQASLATPASPRFQLHLPRVGMEASAQEVDGEFIVLQGSGARGEWIGTSGGYQSLYAQLVASGVLADDAQGRRRFTTDYAFTSPSAAAAVVSGRSANGRVKWTIQGSEETYGEWQERQVALAVPADEDAALSPSP